MDQFHTLTTNFATQEETMSETGSKGFEEWLASYLKSYFDKWKPDVTTIAWDAWSACETAMRGGEGKLHCLCGRVWNISGSSALAAAPAMKRDPL